MLSSRISRSNAKAPTACSGAVLAQPGCKVRLLASRFFVRAGARSHHHIEHVDEFLRLRVAAGAEGAGGQQPVTVPLLSLAFHSSSHETLSRRPPTTSQFLSPPGFMIIAISQP